MKRFLVLLALLGVIRVIAGFYVNAEARQFARRCERVAEGTSAAEARAAFGAARDDEGGQTERARSFAFLFHSGWTGMSCTLEIQSGRVAERRIERWHDLDHCSERQAHPRRFWLCRIGRVLLP
jgi:hypothetical protein